MSDNLEIIMDIETLEVFEVIDLDKKDKSEDKKEKTPKENKATPYDDLGRVWLGNGYYYKSSSLLGKVVRDGIIHELSLEINTEHIPTMNIPEMEHGDMLSN